MAAIERITERLALADLVAFDREGRPILIVAADDRVARPELLAYYLDVLKAIRRNIPFVIHADPEEMTIYRKDRTRSLEPIASMPTRETIRFYDPMPDRQGISKDFLVTLIEAWLSDLIHHWKSSEPPASNVMVGLGLVARLDGGISRRRVRLACLPLPGDELPDQLRNGAEPGSRRHPLETVPVPPADHA